MNRLAVRSLRMAPSSISALSMTPSRASISISVRGFVLTAFRISRCHTGRKRRFSRASEIPAEIRARRVCIDRPMSRRTVDNVTSSPIS